MDHEPLKGGFGSCFCPPAVCSKSDYLSPIIFEDLIVTHKKTFSLRRLQQRDKKKDARLVLQRTVKMFGELHIPYVIDYGTLLGAHRDRDYIQGDQDVDISVPYTYTNVLIELDKDFLSSYDLKKCRTPWEINKEIIKTLLSFTLDEEDFGNLSSRKLSGNGLYIDIYLKTQFPTTFQKFNYGGSMYLGPAHVEEYLDAAYGKGWRKPMDKSGSDEVEYLGAIACRPPIGTDRNLLLSKESMEKIYKT